MLELPDSVEPSGNLDLEVPLDRRVRGDHLGRREHLAGLVSRDPREAGVRLDAQEPQAPVDHLALPELEPKENLAQTEDPDPKVKQDPGDNQDLLVKLVNKGQLDNPEPQDKEVRLDPLDNLETGEGPDPLDLLDLTALADREDSLETRENREQLANLASVDREDPLVSAVLQDRLGGKESRASRDHQGNRATLELRAALDHLEKPGRGETAAEREPLGNLVLQDNQVGPVEIKK